MRAPIFILIALAFFLTQACSSEQNSEQEMHNAATDTVAQTLHETDENSECEIVVYTKYKLPLPVELYRFLKNESYVFQEKLMNPVSNLARYNTSVEQAVSFGIYASDLAYCTVFAQNQDAIIYFHITKKLANELHIDKPVSSFHQLGRIISTGYNAVLIFISHFR